MGRGEGQANRNLGHHRAGGGGGLLDAYRALTAQEQRPAIIRRRRHAGVAVFYSAVRSLFLTPEQRANNSCAAGQGLRTTLRLPGAVAARPYALGGVFPERCVMKPTFAVCAALLGLLALSPSAIAEQKTARQCNDDWSANKAAIQASGKTKRVFMAECRGAPLRSEE